MLTDNPLSIILTEDMISIGLDSDSEARLVKEAVDKAYEFGNFSFLAIIVCFGFLFLVILKLTRF